MELIDKADVVAAIKTIYNEDYKFLPSDLVESVQDFKDDLLMALDGLYTVKEVDFDKEIDNYTNGILASDIQFEPFTHLYKCAKHFFKLGLKAKKGE